MDIVKLVNEAPREVREAAMSHNVSIRRLRRAEEQLSLWTKELELARMQFRVTDADFKDVQLRWDGEHTVHPNKKLEMKNVVNTEYAGESK